MRAGLIILLFTISLSPIADFDLGMHLATGRRIAAEQAIPQTDIFSYTRDGTYWPPHQAGSGWILYQIYQLSGFSGITIFKAILIVLIFLIPASTAVLSRERREGVGMVDVRTDGGMTATGGITGWVLLVVLLAALAARSRFEMRPYLFSTLGLAGLVHGLCRFDRTGRRRELLLVVLIVALGMNLHAGWINGLLYTGLAIIGGALDRVRSQRSFFDFSDLQRMGAIGLGILSGEGIARSIGLPGIASLELPLMLFSDPYFKLHCAEFRPLAFTDWPILALMSGLLLASCWNWRNRQWSTLLPLIGFSILTLSTVRLVIDWAVVAIVPAINGLHALIAPGGFYQRLRPLGIAVVLVAITVFGDQNRSFGLGISPRFYPDEAFRVLEQVQPAGKIFNEDAVGEWFSWRFGPIRKVFVDNRLELYGAAFYQYRYWPIMNAQPGWEQLLDREGVTHLLLWNSPATIPLVGAAVRSPNWKTVFWNDHVVIFFHTQKLKSLVERLGYTTLSPLDGGKAALTKPPELVLPEIERMIRTAPLTSAGAHNLRGVVMARLGNDAAGCQEFRIALQIDAHQRDAKRNLEKCRPDHQRRRR